MVRKPFAWFPWLLGTVAVLVVLGLLMLVISSGRKPWMPSPLQTAIADSSNIQVKLTTRFGMQLVLIPRGEYYMGSSSSDPHAGKDEELHTVVISHSFYMQRHEVTVFEWRVLLGESPERFPTNPDATTPVESVTWLQAVTFCNSLSEREGLPSVYAFEEEQWSVVDLHNGGYRLPTEAEWEYACRAGTVSRYWQGELLTSKDANFDARKPLPDTPRASSPGEPVPVGSYPPNPWGLFDMHGNVAEWCWDYYAEDYPESATDPVGPPSGAMRVYRGGSWFNSALFCRTATRNRLPEDAQRDFVGFRVVRSITP